MSGEVDRFWPGLTRHRCFPSVRWAFFLQGRSASFSHIRLPSFRWARGGGQRSHVRPQSADMATPLPSFIRTTVVSPVATISRPFSGLVDMRAYVPSIPPSERRISEPTPVSIATTMFTTRDP